MRFLSRDTPLLYSFLWKGAELALSYTVLNIINKTLISWWITLLYFPLFLSFSFPRSSKLNSLQAQFAFFFSLSLRSQTQKIAERLTRHRLNGASMKAEPPPVWEIYTNTKNVFSFHTSYYVFFSPFTPKKMFWPHTSVLSSDRTNTSFDLIRCSLMNNGCSAFCA